MVSLNFFFLKLCIHSQVLMLTYVQVCIVYHSLLNKHFSDTDDGSFLLWSGSVRSLVLFWRVQQNWHWSVVCHRTAADYYQKCQSGQGIVLLPIWAAVRQNQQNDMCAQRRLRSSLGICPVWSESSLSASGKFMSLTTHKAHSEDSDPTGWMPRLIWVFTGRTVNFVGFVMLLICQSDKRIVWVLDGNLRIIFTSGSDKVGICW